MIPSKRRMIRREQNWRCYAICPNRFLAGILCVFQEELMTAERNRTELCRRRIYSAFTKAKNRLSAEKHKIQQKRMCFTAESFRPIRACKRNDFHFFRILSVFHRLRPLSVFFSAASIIISKCPSIVNPCILTIRLQSQKRLFFPFFHVYCVSLVNQPISIGER